MSKMPSPLTRIKALQMSGTPSSPCISWQCTYKDSATKIEHVIVVIIAPSGVCHDDLLKCHLQVKEDGKKLIFSSQWPDYSMDMEALHHKLENKLGKSAQDTDICNIWKHSKALLDVVALMHASEQEVLSSTCPITLPIQVYHKINNIELALCTM